MERQCRPGAELTRAELGDLAVGLDARALRLSVDADAQGNLQWTIPLAERVLGATDRRLETMPGAVAVRGSSMRMPPSLNFAFDLRVV